MKINNRRYIGSKTKLLDHIYSAVQQWSPDRNCVFADIFAGTGAVGSYFAGKGYSTILNDTLYVNVVAYNAWHGNGEVDALKMHNIIEEYNDIDSNDLKNNYFSKIYGVKYFSLNDAKKIGHIRDDIEKRKSALSEREYFYLITSLVYATDKIANTVGHFESYLLKEPNDKGVKMLELEIEGNIKPADIYNMDANLLVKQIKCDIAYIDPPYNARQYVNFYHVLENLARWEKPTVFQGKSMKFERQELKSDYCRKKAPELMEQLVSDLDCKLIVVSYNNTYKAGSISSVNTITAEEIVSILEKKGRVTIKEMDYKAFSAGKTTLNGHKEILYICEVNK